MKKLVMAGIIQNGVLKYFGVEDKDKLKLLKQNEGKRVETTIRVISGIKYSIHKYYRGYLLPDITHAAGEESQFQVHELLLKRRFLFKRVRVLDDIPTRHRDKCKFYFDSENALVGYTPSMSTISQEEAKDYIEECEGLLADELNSHLGVSVSSSEFHNHNNSARLYRQEIFK